MLEVREAVLSLTERMDLRVESASSASSSGAGTGNSCQCDAGKMVVSATTKSSCWAGWAGGDGDLAADVGSGDLAGGDAGSGLGELVMFENTSTPNGYYQWGKGKGSQGSRKRDKVQTEQFGE